MKSKLRRKITALMLCGAMIFSGSSSALADSPTGELDENAIVQEEMIETVVEEADTEVTEPVIEEDQEETETSVTEETQEEVTEETTEVETEEASEENEDVTPVDEEVEEQVEETPVVSEVQEEVTETAPQAEEVIVEATPTIAEKVATAVTTVTEAVVEVVEEVIRYIIGMHDDLTYVDENVTIKVYAEADEIIPEGTKIKVVPILADDSETKEKYEEVAAQLEEKAVADSQEIQGFLAYDITLVDPDGNEFEPYGEVKVTMEYKNATLPAEVEATEDTEVTVLHFEEDENGEVAQIVDMIKEEAIEAAVELTEALEVQRAEFVTTSFSTYAVTWSNAAELTFYEQLMAAETCEEVFNLMMGDTEATYALTEDELNALYEKVEAMEDDGYQVDVLDTLEYLMTDGGEAEILKPEDGGSTTATSGTLGHIEIEVASSVSYVIDGKTYTDPLTISLSDTYLVRSYTLDSDGNKVYSNLSLEGTFSKTGSSENGTTYYISIPSGTTLTTGTYSNPVYYEITVYTTHTVTVNGIEITLPVELKTASHYWSSDNYCPGVHMEESESDWEDGYYVGHGMDVPISGEAVSSAITTGKLAIKKTVTDEDGSTATFQFYLQDNDPDSDKYLTYLTFSENAYTGNSDTLTDDCMVTVTAGKILVLTNIPIGQYKITEIQKDGYIVTDTEGNETDNYTKDYIVEEKTDDDIPIANFINKKLSNEAGVKIKKVGEGLASYKNPTVAIYKASDCTNGVPNTGATAVWSGTLTTNSDEFIYLKTTLPAGDYVVVETNADEDGYNLSTTLTSSNTTVSGMTFTAVVNTVHELVVTNTYEQTMSYSVEKIWDDGEATTLRPTEIQVQLYLGDEPVEGKVATLNEDNEWKHTFTGLQINDGYTVKEVEVPGYTVAYNNEDSTKTVITNTLKKLEIIKVWQDSANSGKRPSSLKVTVSKDETSVEIPLQSTAVSEAKTVTIDKAYPMVIGEWKTTIYGMSIEDGYVFEEIEPNGYDLINKDVDEEAETITFTNALDILIVKESATGTNPLEGAIFEITNTTDGTKYYAQSEAADGGLHTWYSTYTDGVLSGAVNPTGTYTLKEKVAPVGYMLSTETWTIEMVNGRIINVSGKTLSEDETPITISGDSVYVISFVNQALYELPSTGGLGIYVPMVGGVLMMMAAVMILMNNKRREVLEK